MQPLLTISLGEAPGQQQAAAPTQAQTQQQQKQAPSETGLQTQLGGQQKTQLGQFQVSPVKQELDKTWGELLKAAGLMA